MFSVDSLVTVAPKGPGEGWCVFLGGFGDTVCVGPYDNPALANEKGDELKRYLGALLDHVANLHCSEATG